MSMEEIKKREENALMHTYGRFPVYLDHGNGATLYDVDGKAYIDLNSGIGVNSIGHNHPQLVEAIQKQAAKLIHSSNLYYTEPMIHVAEVLEERTGFSKMFFANSGAEANEGAIKTARKYSVDKYNDHRTKILTLKDSFHGRTIATLEATGQDKFHQNFFPFTNGFDYIVANDYSDFENKVDDTVCAVLMELVQGESGVKPLDEEYVKQVVSYCNQKDILVIIDEVQTGIGRTGTLFCYEQYDIQPDIITVAKGLGGGLPIGGFLVNEKCEDTLQPGDHGTTFGGNVLSTTAAGVVLSVINDDLLQEVVEKGEYIKKQIAAINSDKVKDIRGKGLMIGIEVGAEEVGTILNQLIEKGVLAIKAGTSTVRLLPPLVITYEEIDQALKAFKEVL